MSALPLRKGWCPGALRPMPSGDGLIVRLRISCGALPAQTAGRIAILAARFGNGSIDLTQRANLQLRGIRENALPALTDELFALGLIDPSAEAEAVRNVILSPLAGHDASCKDGSVMARALETELRDDTSLHALPAKFGFAVDGGGRWPLGATGADVTAYACDDAAPWRIALAGADDVSEPLHWHSVADAMLALAKAFLITKRPRMRDAVATLGAPAMFAKGGLHCETVLGLADRKVFVGALNLSAHVRITAIGLPFGRIATDQLAQLVDAAPAAEIRLTPWRTMAFVCATEAEVERLLAAARQLQLVTGPQDARLAIDACTGAPGCSNGTTPTRDDAARIAQHFGARVIAPGTIHVSGCAKGCAHRGRAAVTFVARDGRYDLVLNGAPTDEPVERALDPSTLSGAVDRVLGQAEARP